MICNILHPSILHSAPHPKLHHTKDSHQASARYLVRYLSVYPAQRNPNIKKNYPLVFQLICYQRSVKFVCSGCPSCINLSATIGSFENKSFQRLSYSFHISSTFSLGFYGELSTPLVTVEPVGCTPPPLYSTCI